MQDDALKELWRNQSVPHKALPDAKGMAAMQRKMKRFDRTIRRRNILEIGAGILVGGYYGVQFFRVSSPLSKVGCIVVLASVLLISWRLLRSKFHQPKVEPSVSLSNAIEIELRKVVTQIGLLKSVLWWYLLPLLTGFTLYDWGIPGTLNSKAASTVVMLLVGSFVYWLNQRAVKNKLLPLKQHLESLLNLEETVPQSPIANKNKMKTMILLGTAIAMVISLPVLIGIKLVNHFKTAVEPDIHELITEAVAADRYVGIVVGVIDDHGTQIYSAGKMEKDGSREVNGDTLFEIASMTKVFTALVLQDMVDRGELNLDDPVEKFLPSSIKVPSKNGKKITLRHLATHRSGLPRLPGNFSPKDKANPYADYTADKLYSFLSSHKLSREPGEKYEYSNLGADLLGLALSRKAGLDYETLVVKRICDPLKMDNTRIRLSPAQQTNFATGHDISGKPVKHWTWSDPLGGAGAFRSSVNDLLKFAAANVATTNSPLSDAMQQTHVLLEPGGLLTPDVGLAWHLQMEYKTKKFKWFAWHNGGTYGFHSYIGLDKEKGRAVVILANSANSVDDLGARVMKHKLFDDVPRQDYAIVPLEAVTYDKYTGEFRFSEKFSVTVTRKDQRLVAQMTDQSPVEIFPRGENKLFYKVANAQLTFETNKNGSVQSVILHQNGLNRRANRVP